MNRIDITLRSVEAADIPWIQRYASDPQISATCNVPYPYPVNGAAAFVDAAMAGQSAGTQFVFAVYAADEFAGLIALNGVDAVTGTAALDYWIAVPFWGRGIGSAAARLAVDFAFRELGLSVLHSGCLARNAASARVLRNSGFREVEGMVHDGAGTGRFAGEPIRLFEQACGDWERR